MVILLFLLVRRQQEGSSRWLEKCYYLVIPVEENEKDGSYDDTCSVAVKQTD